MKVRRGNGLNRYQSRQLEPYLVVETVDFDRPPDPPEGHTQGAIVSTAYVKSSPTSKAAAKAVTKKAKATSRERVLNVITKYGPITDEAIQKRLKMNPSTQRPRRIELVNAGLVVQDAKNGKSSTGRAAARWRLA